VKSLTVTNLEIPLFFSLHDASNSEINANLIDSTIYYPRYVYLELIDYKNKHHEHCYLFTSNFAFENKDIIARITIDYKQYPLGSVFPANLFNGFLLSATRKYKKGVHLRDFSVRMLNECGLPLCAYNNKISFCLQAECAGD
jgi:hypothetical protein